jgi:spermidine/putrescine transport system ATP-binding protein
MNEGSAISIRDVSKSFGDVRAVLDVSLEIAEGEFITLLGPSGCGKTTTMRMIAGFEEPDRGAILLRGADVVGVPPNKREVNMCFQHYALFPHMTVEKNIAYGLKLKKVPKAERDARVAEMLEIVGLAGMGARKPAQLSGGQQQRVALARALVNRPAALLLDEPLGALDVKLRKAMQLELKRIQHELGTTFVYVTHDQEEALSMSDRIAVMNQGRIEQLGTPRDIYDFPETPFVADFVGVLNAIDFRVDEVSGPDAVMRLGDRERIVVPIASTGASAGSTLTVTVRPERIWLRPADAEQLEHPSRVSGKVAQVVYLGTLTQFHVDTDMGKRLIVHELSDASVSQVREGDPVVLSWMREDAAILRQD